MDIALVEDFSRPLRTFVFVRDKWEGKKDDPETNKVTSLIA